MASVINSNADVVVDWDPPQKGCDSDIVTCSVRCRLFRIEGSFRDAGLLVTRTGAYQKHRPATGCDDGLQIRGHPECVVSSSACDFRNEVPHGPDPCVVS